MLAMAIIIILWVLGPHAKEEVLLNEIELKLKALGRDGIMVINKYGAD